MTTITLTADQAFSAYRAIEARMAQTVDAAADTWIADTSQGELIDALFGPNAVDPEKGLARYEAEYLADAALADHLRDLPHDARLTALHFRGYVEQTAHRILNHPKWGDRPQSPAQKALAVQDFGRV